MFHLTAREIVARASLALLLATTAAAHSKESDLAIKELPKAVVDAIAAGVPSAKLLHARQRSRHGSVLRYDVKVEARDGESLDVYLDGEAKILATGVDIL